MELIEYRKFIFQELVTNLLRPVDNAVVCSENDALSIVKRPIAPLIPERVRAAPRPVLNALMACIAVHMAARNRGNRQLYRLALELKACVFNSFNRMLQQERRSPSDLEICVVVLLFALDVSIPLVQSTMPTRNPACWVPIACLWLITLIDVSRLSRMD